MAAKRLFRMELTAGTVWSTSARDAVIVGYCPALHHYRIPQLYAGAFSEEPWPNTWDEFDEFDPNGVFLAVDRVSDEAIGYIISFQRNDFGYISVVAVMPQFRRRGIASALMSAAIQYLRSLGRGMVRIDVDATNTPAMAAYTKLGFRVVDTFTE